MVGLITLSRLLPAGGRAQVRSVLRRLVADYVADLPYELPILRLGLVILVCFSPGRF
jgi:hypothetical protein